MASGEPPVACIVHAEQIHRRSVMCMCVCGDPLWIGLWAWVLGWLYRHIAWADTLTIHPAQSLAQLFWMLNKLEVTSIKLNYSIRTVILLVVIISLGQTEWQRCWVLKTLVRGTSNTMGVLSVSFDLWLTFHCCEYLNIFQAVWCQGERGIPERQNPFLSRLIVIDRL